MNKIIDVQLLAKALETQLLLDVKRLHQQNITPHLSTILIGDDPASHIYVNAKMKKTQSLNIKNQLYNLPENTSEQQLLDLITSLNANVDTHGILVQLPLPKHINPNKILQHINPNKDIDGLHPVNTIKLLHNDSSGFVPCTPLACEYVIKQVVDTIMGKNICIIGRSQLVGLPLFHLLLNQSATLTIAHSKTLNLANICQQADILVSAVGLSKFINQDYVKKGQIIIDVGISRIFVDNKKYITGDVDIKSVLPYIKAITPVPKGIGILTILFLMQNVIKAACKINHIN